MNRKRREAISEIVERLEELMSDVECLRDEESEAYENLPEGIQLSDRGERMSGCVDSLEEALGCIEESIGYLMEAKGE